jgi:hypothetical protein
LKRPQGYRPRGRFRLSSAGVVVAAVRSLATYVAVSSYILVTGLVGMLLATLFGWVDLLYVFGHGGVRLGMALAGIKYRLANRSHPRPGTRLPDGRLHSHRSQQEGIGDAID